MTNASVKRKQSERLAACAPQRPEVALVGAQKIQCSVTVGEYDDRRVRQADPKVGVTLHDAVGVTDILGPEDLELTTPRRPGGVLGARTPGGSCGSQDRAAL